jgi:hypothetical protein
MFFNGTNFYDGAMGVTQWSVETFFACVIREEHNISLKLDHINLLKWYSTGE